MLIRWCLAGLLAIGLSAAAGLARAQSEPPSSTLLARGQLASVVELPVYFRLYRVWLPAGRHASYRGSSAMLYDLAGGPAMELEGAEARTLADSAGVFVAPGQGVTISAAASEPTDLLLFILSARPNQKPPFDRPAIVKELFRTGDPLPDLQPGPYAFTLTRLSFPPGTPATPPHYRTGAALNFILAGSGSLIADGKTEAMPAGSTQAALAGWFHQWANPGETPLVILRASIDPENSPAVVPEPAK